ncbi:MAG TPA: cupredoxin family copper-binding protein [Candidatus Nanoarchaeia archaeon]|nr:cupredoxin family copper-binding protein [Candidatus Nanoarchaeia archaeon]
MKPQLIFGILIIVILISGCSVPKLTSTEQSPTVVAEKPSLTEQPDTAAVADNVADNADTVVDNNVEISGFSFNPNLLTIPQGASVVWINLDSAPHTVVSEAGAEIQSDRLSQGNTYAHTFNLPGIYDYYCSIHPSMKGKIIVE